MNKLTNDLEISPEVFKETYANEIARNPAAAKEKKLAAQRKQNKHKAKWIDYLDEDDSDDWDED